MVEESESNALIKREARAYTAIWKALLPEAGRAALVVGYALGAFFNTTWMAQHPEAYTGWSDEPIFPIYHDIFTELVLPNGALVLTLVGIYQAALALLLYWPGKWSRAALAGGIAFNVVLAPLWVAQAGPILLLAAIQLLLMRHNFEHNALDGVCNAVARRTGRQPA